MEWIETFEAILRAMLAQAEAERQKIDLAYLHQGTSKNLILPHTLLRKTL